MTHSSLTRRTAYLSGLRIPARIAAELASGANRVAAACMLELYRTSQQPVMRHLGEQLPAAAQRPGLVFWRPPITAPALALPAARPPNAPVLRSPRWLDLVTGGCCRIQPP
jgi:hypothetical protein